MLLTITPDQAKEMGITIHTTLNMESTTEELTLDDRGVQAVLHAYARYEDVKAQQAANKPKVLGKHNVKRNLGKERMERKIALTAWTNAQQDHGISAAPLSMRASLI